MLEFHTNDRNSLTVHFNKELTEISLIPEKDMGTGTTHKCAVCGDDDDVAIDIDDEKYCVDSDNHSIEMMGEAICSIKGLRSAKLYDYEIVLAKSPHFTWEGIINGVVATVLLFLEPYGKAIEIPFIRAKTNGKKERKRKKKENSKKTAEIFWNLEL